MAARRKISAGLARWRQSLIVAVTCGVLGGCCTLQREFAPRIRDRLQTYVMVWVGERPKCLLPCRDRVARTVVVGEATTVFLRAVFKDALRKPANPIPVALEAIDPWGDVSSNVYIEPATVMTDSLGFNAKPIVIRADKHIGGFYIRARYQDRHSTATTLSRLIVVTF